MATDILRPRSIDEHPLRRRIYRVPTPSIKAMINLVDECLFLFLGGALIHGRPRIGKSCAIDFVLTNLNAKSPKLRIPRDPGRRSAAMADSIPL